tara:strand:+ start:10893 stop:11075 length:183 start_codon:yes stop_codon:yes gene_type:complete
LLIAISAQTIAGQNLEINKKTIIKGVDGKTINIEKFSKLMNSIEWMLNQKLKIKATAKYS